MQRIFYNSNGIKSYIPIPKLFHIEEWNGQQITHLFEYDNFFYDFSSFNVNISEHIEEKIFPELIVDPDAYYQKCLSMPMWVMHLGIKSDIAGGNSDSLNKYIMSTSDEFILRQVFLYDILSLLDSFVERLILTKELFVRYYIMLCNIRSDKDCDEDEKILGDVFSRKDENVYFLYNTIYILFINLYSSLDLITKFVYLLEKINFSANTIKRFPSKDILYGDRKCLKQIKKENNLFDYDNSYELKVIASVRNEIVHNGSWDSNHQIYIKKTSLGYSKAMYIPDLNTHGAFESCLNRKHFYSQSKEINLILPHLYHAYLKLTKQTFLDITDCLLKH